MDFVVIIFGGDW